MLRSHVILAVFKRNLMSYFSSVLGYLFIVVFVVAGAIFAFDAQFFTNNQANLDRLSIEFPLLLLFIIPAITMSTWADEKKLGTDELLFTLPASDVEILLGKYLSVLTVYAVALLFSITHLFVLGYYADPDWGLLFATFVGYFVAGAALVSAGMFASVLTSSPTVAFVLGAVICSIPVGIGQVAPNNELIRDLSVTEQFRDFGLGMIPLSSLLYFGSLTVLMLYLNIIMISKRHWSSGRRGSDMGIQFSVRAAALAVTLISLNVVVAKSGEVFDLRWDLTAENIYTLSDTTEEMVDKIDEDNAITIQAFMSPDVPRELVVYRKRLAGLLRQYDRIGGRHVEVRLVNVQEFSEEADEARLAGIQPRRIQSEQGGRFTTQDVYLGVVISSPFDEVVIPFFERGVSIEYELTRSIRTVARQERKTIGVLQTDAKVNGGFDMSSFRSTPEWQIKNELKKQYIVEQVAPDAPIEEGKYDVLLAIMPSSLTQPQMQNLVAYVSRGNPVLVMDDPMTWYDGGQTAPRQPKPSPGGGGMFNQQRQQAPPKADGGSAKSLMDALGIDWRHDQVVWDQTGQSLHPVFAELVPEEFVFISPKSGNQFAFSPKSEITSGLQEILLVLGGSLATLKSREDDLKFQPLLRTGKKSGRLNWDEFTQPSFPFGGIGINPDPVRVLDEDFYTVAIQITSKDKKENEGIDAIFIADVDMISNQLFRITQGKEYDLQLDNVKFLLNCVDVLAGDDSYVELRKKRAVHRTLTEVQERTDEFREKRQEADEAAKKEADKELDQRKKSLAKKVEEIEKNENLTPQDKAQQIEIARREEQRKLDVAKAIIERKKEQTERQNKDREQQQIRAVEEDIRIYATILPPILPFLLGVFVLLARLNAERREIEPSRRVGG